MILIDTDKNLMAIITEPKVETDVSLAMAEHLAELEEFHSNAKIFTRKIEAYLADLTAQARYLATLPERLAERGHK